MFPLTFCLICHKPRTNDDQKLKVHITFGNQCEYLSHMLNSFGEINFETVKCKKNARLRGNSCYPRPFLKKIIQFVNLKLSDGSKFPERFPVCIYL